MGKKGRPAGSPNVTAIAHATPAMCPYCQSTEKKYLGSRNVQEYAHEHDGQIYTHLIKRRAQCDGCQRIYIETSHENGLTD